MSRQEEHYRIITDAWKLLQDFDRREFLTESDWQELIETADKLIQRHGESEAATTMIVAVMEVIEKERSKDG